jgi:hypothetical protein
VGASVGDADDEARFSAKHKDFATDRQSAGYPSRDLVTLAVTELGEIFREYSAVSKRAVGDRIDESGGAEMRTTLESPFVVRTATGAST